MEILVDDNGVIIFKGALVASNIDNAHAVLENIFECSGRNVHLDLTGVDEIDISGLQLIYSIKKTFSTDGNVRIVAMSPQVDEAMEISGFAIALKEILS